LPEIHGFVRLDVQDQTRSSNSVSAERGRETKKAAPRPTSPLRPHPAAVPLHDPLHVGETDPRTLELLDDVQRL
jgi:hypothetical protein